MPAITQEQALERLTKAVQEDFAVDELLEIHNEVFPDHPYTMKEAEEDSRPLIERLVARINSGFGIGDVMEMWGLIFTKHRNIWYNEVEDRMHYDEEAEAVSSE